MYKKTLSLAIALSFSAGFASASDDPLRAQAKAVGLAPLPQTVEIPDNAITPEKVALGQMLFFEPRISASQLISCNTCHNLGTGGDDNLPTSVGHGWQKGPRNAPTVLNAVFNKAQFWDGRAEDLKAQAKGPVQASVEMANKPENVVATLKSMPEYVARFEAAFPEEKDPVTFDNMARAIEAFEATLLTPDAPFDRWLAGEDEALTADQKAGLKLFVQKGCTACHSGVNVGGQGYFPFGMVQKPDAKILPPEDKGRFKVTQSPADTYVFRAAPLRNVALTAPYFHSGQVWDLKEAVSIMGQAQLGMALSEEEAGLIAQFLESLTGKQPQVSYPILPVETAETPRPAL